MGVDACRQWVRFAKKGVEVDPGGIGKGYAVDRIAQILKDNGVQHALVSGGGASIYAIGAPPNEKGLKLDQKNTKDPSYTPPTCFLLDGTIFTASKHEKYLYSR